MTLAAPTLTTERLTLRAWRIDAHDAQALFAYAKHPDIGPQSGWQPHDSVETSRWTIEHLFQTPTTWAIVMRDVQRDTPIGCVALKTVDDVLIQHAGKQAAQSAYELGYTLAEDYWGLGIIPEACETIFNYAFETLQIQQIWGVHNVENRQSRRVMEKLGMKRVAVLPHIPHPLLGEDVFWDEILRHISREEWEKEPHLRDYFVSPSEFDVLAIDGITQNNYEA